MPPKSLLEKAKRKPKFKVRHKNRCSRCGRSKAFVRRFGLCRLCFREMVHNGEIPGITKASW